MTHVFFRIIVHTVDGSENIATVEGKMKLKLQVFLFHDPRWLSESKSVLLFACKVNQSTFSFASNMTHIEFRSRYLFTSFASPSSHTS